MYMHVHGVEMINVIPCNHCHTCTCTLLWRHNGHDGVSNHQPHECLLNHRGADQRKHRSSELLAFVGGIHRRPVNSPHNWPVTRKMFPFDDVIMIWIMKNKFTWRRYYIHPQGTDVHLYYLRTLLPEVHEGIYTLDKLYHHTYMVWM